MGYTVYGTRPRFQLRPPISQTGPVMSIIPSRCPCNENSTDKVSPQNQILSPFFQSDHILHLSCNPVNATCFTPLPAKYLANPLACISVPCPHYLLPPFSLRIALA